MKFDDLIKECPNLYRNGMCFECGEGWYDLIRDLSLKLEDLIVDNPYTSASELLPTEETGFLPSFYAVQVKEKFGTLRFYMSTETDEMEDLIEKAEFKSESICEICGKTGVLDTSGWCEVRCATCRLQEKAGK